MQGIKRRSFALLTAFMLVLMMFTLLPQGVLRAEAFSYLDDNMISWYFSVDGAIAGGGANEEGATILSGTLKGGGDFTMVTVPSSVVDDEYHMTHPVIGLKASFDQAVFPSSIEYVFLPDTLLSIGYRAFSKFDKLQSITLPDGLTEIGDHAFFDCRSLKTITIPAGVKEINPSAFESCDQLAEVKFAEGTKLNAIYQKAFAYCSYLSSIEIPSTVTEIGPYAFNSCRSLTSINIPSSVTKIGAFAFDGCSRLKTVYIPASVTEIGADAFGFIGYGATIYGYSGSYAETYANENSLNFRAIDTQVNALGFSEITMENGTMAYTARNGRERTGITELTASSTPNINDIKIGTTVTMTPGEVPEEYEFKGYEVTYDFTATVNGTAYHVYHKTLSRTADENTFLVDVPAEAKDRLIPFIIMKLNSSKPQNITIGGKITGKAVLEKVSKDLGTLTFDLSKSTSVTNDDPTLYDNIYNILRDNNTSKIYLALFENGAEPYKYTYLVDLDKKDTYDVNIYVKDGKLTAQMRDGESASGAYTLSMKDSSIAEYTESGKDYYSKLKFIFPSADTYEPADFGTMTLDFTLAPSYVIKLYTTEKANRIKATLYALGKSGRIGTYGIAAFDMDKDGTNDFEINDTHAVMYTNQTVGEFTDYFELTAQEISYVKEYYRNTLGITAPADLKDACAGYHGKIGMVFPAYGLTVAGVEVNSKNSKDILGDGVFKYNAATKTLTVNGNCNSGDKTLIQNVSAAGLVIDVTGTSKLTSDLSFLSAKANTTITGQGNLTVDCKYAGIAIDKDVTVTIKDTKDVSITATGVGGNLVISDNRRAGNRNNKIIFDNANVYLESKTSAACAIVQDIILKDCTITKPENGYIEESKNNNYKSIAVKDGAGTSSFATVVRIEGNKSKKGDVNRDGTVDLSDYSDLAKYFAEWTGYDEIIDPEAADLNNSGAPDLDDLSILAKCFAEWTGYQETYLS